LFSDADEHVTPELKEEILTEIKKQETAEAYFFKRNSYLKVKE
jgi:hypothetical protein